MISLTLSLRHGGISEQHRSSQVLMQLRENRGYIQVSSRSISIREAVGHLQRLCRWTCRQMSRSFYSSPESYQDIHITATYIVSRVSNRSATVQPVRQLGFFASVSQLRIILESVSQLE
jgi:hypothetical protein